MFVRYETPTKKVLREDGPGTETITRREYNRRFNQPAPEIDIPEAGEYLWEWYHDINRRVRRVHEGVCGTIPPTEWLAWAQVAGHIVYPWEYGILASMDIAFCDEQNIEFEARRQAEQPPPPRGK